MMLRRIFSNGCPFRSYMASRKNGSITRIMQIAAVLTPVCAFVRKKSGTPMAAPQPKQISCLFVRLNNTLVLTVFNTNIFLKRLIIYRPLLYNEDGDEK